MYYPWDIIGHEKELLQLEKDIRGGSIHHAYLLVGPEKIGKFRVAKTMAHILQCPRNFCHSCPTCIQIQKKGHPDTIELDDDGESIKINVIREIITRLNMTTQSAYKILLIGNIGRLTEEAANCLLKTLEEPHPGTVFIFTASHIKDIMPTISSRMRTVQFKKLPDEVLRTALKKTHPEMEDEMLDHVILLSLGRSGQALQLLNNPEFFSELRDMYQHIQFLAEKASLALRITAVENIVADAQKMHTFLSLLAHYVRRSLMQTQTWNERSRAIHTLQEIHRTVDLTRRNVNPRLLLENVMLSL